MSPDEKLVNVRVVSSGEGKARFQIKHNISPQIVYVLMNETIHSEKPTKNKINVFVGSNKFTNPNIKCEKGYGSIWIVISNKNEKTQTINSMDLYFESKLKI